MRRIIFFPKVVLILLLVLSTSMIAATYSGGIGTRSDPYQIANTADLKYLSEHRRDWSKYFIQTANIEFTSADFQVGGEFYNSGDGFSPIGNNSTKFTGSYDGNGFAIDGLFISRRWTYFVGLFGYTKGATIKNLGVTDVVIIGYDKTGGLAGYLSSNSTVSNCYSTGDVAGFGYIQVGGLVGENESSTISNSYSSAIVTGWSHCMGGLVGGNLSNAVISNCYSTGSVTGNNSVGGLVGINTSSSVILNSYSTGAVSGHNRYNNSVGGLVGDNVEASTISNCYSTGDVTRGSGSTYTEFGGFCAYTRASTIEYCYSTGSVYYEGAANPTDKGFVGYTDGSSTHTANFWDSEASNQSSATGAVGKTTAEMHTQSTFTNAGWDFMGESANGTNDYWTMDVSGVINNGYAILFWQTLGYTSVEADKNSSGHLPDRTELEAAYPNPFNPQTKIRYRLAKNATVHVVVYNALGEPVKRLVTGIRQSAGRYEILWNALNDRSEMVPSGMYIVVLKAGGYVKSEKVLLLH